MIGFQIPTLPSEGGEKMEKKILGAFVGLLAISIFFVPVIAKTQTPITYTKQADYLIPDFRSVGKNHDDGLTAGSVYQILNSEQAGSIWEGGSTTGDPAFTYFTMGKMIFNFVSGKAVWQFDTEWTSATEIGGFEGVLNGESGPDGVFIVQGVLQGFGYFKGQKLVVQEERQGPNSMMSTITGICIEH